MWWAIKWGRMYNRIKRNENNKSPGSDRITTEFYKIFWNDIKKFYIYSLNHSYQCGALTELQNQSIISLISKSDKDTSILENWRPISLLNVDYKIATKTIANRLKKVLPKLIHDSQNCFSYSVNHNAMQSLTSMYCTQPVNVVNRSRGYKTYFMLDSTEHEISTAH